MTTKCESGRSRLTGHRHSAGLESSRHTTTGPPPNRCDTPVQTRDERGTSVRAYSIDRGLVVRARTCHDGGRTTARQRGGSCDEGDGVGDGHGRKGCSAVVTVAAKRRVYAHHIAAIKSAGVHITRTSGSQAWAAGLAWPAARTWQSSMSLCERAHLLYGESESSAKTTGSFVALFFRTCVPDKA